VDGSSGWETVSTSADATSSAESTGEPVPGDAVPQLGTPLEESGLAGERIEEPGSRPSAPLEGPTDAAEAPT
jgi:hypothetical protein